MKIFRKYRLDFESNGALDITAKNLHIIESALRIDSRYRTAIDKKDPDYSKTYAGILESGKPDLPNDRKTLAEVINSIDKMNSTHLSVQNGREITTDFIWGISKQEMERRLCGADDLLVEEIAHATIKKGKTRFNLSFASKFCAYTSKIVFEMDNFCVYDSVVQSILPYYSYKYAKQVYYKKNRSHHNVSTVAELTKKSGYVEYRRIVDELIDGIKRKKGLSVTYGQLDSLLWYYYKGAHKRVNALMDMLP